MKVLVTGGTGHLGATLVQKLLQLDATVTLLVRPNSIGKISVDHGLMPLLGQGCLSQGKKRVNQIKIVMGDISLPRCGLTQQEYKEISSETTVIYHSAALLDLVAPIRALERANVQGTKNVLDLASACMGRDNFQGVCHVSTFAVAGAAKEVFYEEDLETGQRFHNNYEQSKFEAEKLVEEYRSRGIPISIFRPSIIVGDSKTGEAKNFHTLYGPLHFMSFGLYEEIPAKGDAKFNLVTVDHVAEAIHQIIIKRGIQNRTYHLVNPHEITCDFLIETASKHFGFKKPLLIPIDRYNYEQLRGYRKRLLLPYLPYLNREPIKWDDTNTRKALAESLFQWPIIDESMLGKLFAYCVKSGYILPKTKRLHVVVSNPLRFSKEMTN
jgi:thioester reductase-like protein